MSEVKQQSRSVGAPAREQSRSVGASPAAWAVVAILAAATVAWRIICEPWSDDYWYFLMYLEKTPVETFSDVLKSFHDHYIYFNCRLSHLLVYSLNLLPWWLTQLICGVFVVTLWQALVWAIGGRKGLCNLLSQTALFLTQWFWLPWGDNMQSVDFLINYAPPSILSLVYMRLYFYRIAGLTKGQMWILGLTAFLAGWWHEGFAVILLILSLIPLISRKNRRRRLTIFLVLFVGFLPTWGPGTLWRMSYEGPDGEWLDLLQYSITRIIYGAWPLFAVSVVALYMGWRKGWVWTRDELVRLWPWIAGAVLSWGTGVSMFAFERVAWPMYLFTLVAIGAMLWRGVTIRRGWAWWVTTAVTCLLSAAFMAGLISLQWRYSQEQRKMVAPLATGEKLALVAELPLVDMAPWWTAWIPHRYSNELFLTSVQHQLTSYYRPDLDGKVILTIPKCLEGLPFDQWPKIPGDNDLRGIWPLMVGTENEPYNWTLTFGERTPGWSPIRELLYRIHPVDRIEHWQYAVWPCVLPDGTEAYLYNYCTPWLNLQIKYRAVTRVDRGR
ncbi:MAG: DUF6056 family protein [Bacteroidales bacterium]|nr:DUF6056 family protein [Bacteroidales bacterium]